MTCPGKIDRCRGFTITELMVTLVTTSVLAVGAGGFLAAVYKSHNVQTAVSGLNASGRFGLDQVARDIRMAGYRDSNWVSGPLVDAIAGADGASANGGDSLTLQYEGARDCNFAVPAGGVVSNTYQVVDETLQCNTQALVDGVQEMQVYFGEDISGDGVPNRWLSPSTEGLDRSRVVSIRIHLLVATDSNDISWGARQYYFDNALRQGADDGQIRREYSMTVALRNQT